MENFDKMIRNKMKTQAVPILPEYTKKTDAIVNCLALSKTFYIRRHFKKIVIAVLMLLCTGTVYASYNMNNDRFETVDDKELKDINDQIQDSDAQNDTYSRALSDAEKEQMNTLRKKYQDGKCPENKLVTFKKISDVGNTAFCYCYENSCFYIPKTELTEEQLLEIIDFSYLRNYALSKNNAQERTGDIKDDETYASSETSPSKENSGLNDNAAQAQQKPTDKKLKKKDAEKKALELAGLLTTIDDHSHVYSERIKEMDMWNIQVISKKEDYSIDVYLNDRDSREVYAGFYDVTDPEYCEKSNDDIEYLPLEEQTYESYTDKITPIAEYFAGNDYRIDYTYRKTPDETLSKNCIFFIVVEPDDYCHQVTYSLDPECKGVQEISTCTSYENYIETIKQFETNSEGERIWIKGK